MAKIIFEKLTVEEEKKVRAGEVIEPSSPQLDACTLSYPRITCVP